MIVSTRDVMMTINRVIMKKYYMWLEMKNLRRERGNRLMKG